MSDPANLFSPFSVGGITLPNRIVVSPMCQYSSHDGFATDWHLVHLGSRAVGGAGLLFVEATAVSPEGRISPGDMGIWREEHIEKLKQIATFVHSQGAFIGIQLAHAGRKASMRPPWETEGVAGPAEGGWTNVVAPSPIPFASNYATPLPLDLAGIKKILTDFGAAARRARQAGFDVIEIHGAHGYLLHEFCSPLSNARSDRFGGPFENRTALLIETVDAVRKEWSGPLFVRISATDWAEGGWDVEQSIKLAPLLASHGANLIDVSSAGLVPGVKIPAGPGYQTGFAERIRKEASVPTGTVGFITDPAQADHIVRTGQADLVFMAREMLRDPYWAAHAAQRLGAQISWPVQYLRAAPPGSTPRKSRTSPHEN
jgi:2,4-dienoyl-CoA reductase-like NADH-dependent reductase (Old Yellow Enzyme family)